VEIPSYDGISTPREAVPDAGTIRSGACGGGPGGQPVSTPLGQNLLGAAAFAHPVASGLGAAVGGRLGGAVVSGRRSVPPFGLALVLGLAGLRGSFRKSGNPAGPAGRAQRKAQLRGARALLQRGESVAFYTEIARAVTVYLADKQGVAAAGLTRDGLAAALSARGAIRRRRWRRCCGLDRLRPCPLRAGSSEAPAREAMLGVPTRCSTSWIGERVTALRRCWSLPRSRPAPSSSRRERRVSVGRTFRARSRPGKSWSRKASPLRAGNEPRRRLSAPGQAGAGGAAFRARAVPRPGDDDARADLIELRRGNVDA